MAEIAANTRSKEPAPPLRWMQWAGDHELVLLAGILGFAATIGLFIGLAALVSGDSIASLDARIMLAFRADGNPEDPFGPSWLEESGRDLTALGGMICLFLLVAAAIVYLLLLSKWRTALLVAASIGGGTLANLFLKAMFDRPRPDLVVHQAEVFTSSFPSGHAMSSAITFLTLGALLARSHSRRRMRAFLILTAILLTVLVGLSRVYLGVHWPSDVLAGWAAGAAWALMVWLLARTLQRRRDIEPESD